MDGWHLLLLGVVAWLLGACGTLAWAVYLLAGEDRKAMRIIPSAFILGPLGPPLFMLLLRRAEEEQARRRAR